MSRHGYSNSYGGGHAEYVSAPPPPPPRAGPRYEQEYAPAPPAPPAPPPPVAPPRDFYAVPQPAQSSFTPHIGFDPPSPRIIPVSPTLSATPSRSSSRNPSEFIVGGNERRHYLNPGGLGRTRSNSDGNRGRVMMVEQNFPRRPHSRQRSLSRGFEHIPARASSYYDDDGYSDYSDASYDSRDSRFQSRSRSRRRHSRSPSVDSFDSFEDDRESRSRTHQMVRYKEPSRDEKRLATKLQELQQQLAKVSMDATKHKEAEEEAINKKLLEQEIERKVAEKIQMEKERERREAAMRAQHEAEERRRIEHMAQKLLNEQAQQQKAREDAKRADEERIQKILAEDRAKNAPPPKKTLTRFSKQHLEEEALRERGLDYTDAGEHFLVEGQVTKDEQNYLWRRSRQIREYYQQIQLAAEQAPTVRTADGKHVKYVQIKGQPYPLALPVTIQETPGGGKQAKVRDIRFSDIFRPSKH